jgi:hypothetical protein
VLSRCVVAIAALTPSAHAVVGFADMMRKATGSRYGAAVIVLLQATIEGRPGQWQGLISVLGAPLGHTLDSPCWAHL